MVATQAGARVTDETKRLIDTVCQALRATALEDVGALLQTQVFGQGRMLVNRSGQFEFSVTGELMMRQILDACARMHVTDTRRRQDCLLAIRAAGFRV